MLVFPTEFFFSVPVRGVRCGAGVRCVECVFLGVFPGVFSSKCLGVLPSECLGVFPAKFLGVFPSKCLGVFPSEFLGVFPAKCLGVLGARGVCAGTLKKKNIQYFAARAFCPFVFFAQREGTP